MGDITKQISCHANRTQMVEFYTELSTSSTLFGKGGQMLKSTPPHKVQTSETRNRKVEENIRETKDQFNS